MKIGSVIKPRQGNNRQVTVHGTDYFFTAMQDKDGVTHFVAEVREPAHAECLMASDAFYAYGSENEPASTLKRGATAPIVKPPVAPVHAPDVLAAARDLLKGSVADISRAVGKSNEAIITAAIDTEKANAKPRANVIGLLQATLDGIRQAGPQK
jgi:hypothetical protein